MTNQDRITELEKELEVARKDAQPVLIEKTLDTNDEVVYENRTTGTHRKDFKGGEKEQYVYIPEKPWTPVEKAIDPAVGKVVSEDATKRVVELVGSKTVRTDHR